MASCWIQAADCSHTELGELDAQSAIRAFEGYGWEEALKRRRFLESTASEACEPGIGFVAEDGRILHVCPLEEGKVMLHYHFEGTEKVLWFFSRRSAKIRTRAGIRRGEVPEIIRRFFANDHAWLLSKTAT